MSWVTRTAGRLDEMSQGKLSLRIEVHSDGDVVLYIDENGIPIRDMEGNTAQVEFCASGGTSLHTRKALIDLMKAMVQDNRADPSGIPPFPLGLAEAMERES